MNNLVIVVGLIFVAIILIIVFVFTSSSPAISPSSPPRRLDSTFCDPPTEECCQSYGLRLGECCTSYPYINCNLCCK